MRKGYKHWHKEDIKMLTELWAKGLPLAEIGMRLGRSPWALSNKASKLGLPLHPMFPRKLGTDDRREGGGKKRTCLRCQKSFFSAHVGNRICNTCKRHYDFACSIYA